MFVCLQVCEFINIYYSIWIIILSILSSFTLLYSSSNFCFKLSKAVYWAVETGLSVSDVSSTLPKPTWAFVTPCGLFLLPTWAPKSVSVAYWDKFSAIIAVSIKLLTSVSVVYWERFFIEKGLSETRGKLQWSQVSDHEVEKQQCKQLITQPKLFAKLKQYKQSLF